MSKAKNQAADAPKPDAEEKPDAPEEKAPVDPRADDPPKDDEQSNEAAQPSAFEPSKEEFVEYLQSDEVQSLAAKFGLVVTVSDAQPEKVDAKKWPSWRYKDGSAKTGKLFTRPEDVPPGWTDAITKE